MKGAIRMDYKQEIIRIIKDTDNYNLLKFIYGILQGAEQNKKRA
jgi:hypothetical protein